MSDSKEKKFWFYARKVLIAALVAACLLALWWLIADIIQSFRSGYLHPGRSLRRQFLSSSQIPSTSYIQPWMTFDYISRVFHLTPNYLKTSLGILDIAYPRLQLQKYAQNHGLNVQTFLAQVRRAVENFSAQ